MIKLKEIDYSEFLKSVNSYYEELFDYDERQPLSLLEELFNKGIIKFIKIMDKDINVGFIVYASTLNNPYVWLEYFAIYKEYQNKQYGTMAIQEFKKFFNGYEGIYGEIEKLGNGKTEEENLVREKRLKFWENLGFKLVDIDLDLFDVLYSPCILSLKDTRRKDEELVNYGFMLYEAVLGKEEVNKHCFIVKD